MIVVIPMAGRGSRFGALALETPKPLIEVCGRPMLAWAFQSIADIPYSRVVFVALAEHAERFDVPGVAEGLAGKHAEVIQLETVTDGQLCTVLAARDVIDTDEDVLVASSDTLVVSELGRDIRNRAAECRGLISVARLPGDRWSFAAVDSQGWVTQVAEKQRISPLASTGLYYFASGREFLAVADAMIADRDTTLGEYCVIPVYRRYLEAGKKIGISEARETWDMGTPDALRQFEEHARAGPASSRNSDVIP